MRSPLPRIIFAASLGMMAVGCVSSHGPLYSSIQNSKDLAAADGKSLILIYWHDPMGGVSVYVNDEMIATIGPGKNGFLSYQADPGYLRISSGVATGKVPVDILKYGLLVTATEQKG